MAISVPDFYRHVFQNPPDSRVPNVKGRYPQWGFKAPSKQGEITLFVWVFLLSFFHWQVVRANCSLDNLITPAKLLVSDKSSSIPAPPSFHLTPN